MPVQMWHHVAEAGQIDLVGLHDFPHRRFHREYHRHQALPLLGRQIGHFFDMGIQYDAAEAGVIGIVDPGCVAEGVGPEKCLWGG